MGTNNPNFKMVAYARFDGFGNLIPGTVQWRPKNFKMDRKIWKQLSPTDTMCCNAGDSFILFRNTTASANYTAISTSDGAINWTGTLANGDYLVFNIPNSYNETWSITVDTPSSRTLTTSTEQGTGTISAIGSITLATNTATTTATPGSLYLVILS